MAGHEFDETRNGLNRRLFMAAGATVATMPLLTKELSAETGKTDQRAASVCIPVALQINKKAYRLSLDVRTSLLDAIRDHAGLTGTKKGCDHGQCGACTVHINGKRALSCMSFAVMNEGKDITTIEGLVGTDDQLHPMQQAFIDNDAFQCGYCTPGQIMSAIACVRENHAGTDEDIREYMSGNLCRCAAYPNIVDAVKQGKAAMEKG
jgi:xanthine dehydrogenase YagT iron-sulfur-binding subunit